MKLVQQWKKIVELSFFSVLPVGTGIPFLPLSLSLSLSLRRGLSPKIFGEWNFLGALLLSIRTGRCVAFHIRSASIAIVQHSRRIESLLAPPHFLPSPLGPPPPVSRNDTSQTGQQLLCSETGTIRFLFLPSSWRETEFSSELRVYTIKGKPVWIPRRNSV